MFAFSANVRAIAAIIILTFPILVAVAASTQGIHRKQLKVYAKYVQNRHTIANITK